MNTNPTLRTTEERWEIKRIAARVCEEGALYRPERQALAFIAEAQTMRAGVCSKALGKGEASGYSKRALRDGIQGRRRDGRVAIPGLLMRHIIYVTGGHPKGGLAPGGAGLTPAYAIDVDVLLTYIPNGDEPPELPEKDETKGTPSTTPKGTPSSERATPKEGHVPPSSLSSYVFTSQPESTTPSASETPAPTPTAGIGDIAIFPTGDPAPTLCFSKQASQTKPPTAVTCPWQVSPTASALEKQSGGLQLQTALSRIAKQKFGNHRRIPKNLTGKFELLAIAHGMTAVSHDFGTWCDEDPAAKRKISFPIHTYIKVVDARLSGVPAEDVVITDGVDELSALSYDLTKILTTKKQQRQIAELLKAYPISRIQDALVYYIGHLPEDPTSSSLQSFWTASSVNAVLKKEHRMRDATDEGGDEDIHPTKPKQHDLPALKRNVGTLPFEQRLELDDQGYSSCPFHNGDGEKSFHVELDDDGVGLGTCFSSCAKTFDAIAFVEKFDKVSTGESIRKLVSIFGDIENGAALQWSVMPYPRREVAA